MSDLPKPLRFADFELNVAQGELRQDGQNIKIRHQTLQLLCYLARQPGITASRIELAEHLWNSSQIDFDQRLNAAVRDLRKTLGDDARQPQLIQTIPRQGYRLAAPIRNGSSDLRHSTRRVAQIAIAAALVVALGTSWWLQRPGASVVAEPARQFYVEARTLLDAGDPAHYPSVMQLLASAIEQEPDYADAWAALAKVHAYTPANPAQTLPQAKQAALRALEIDPGHIGALRQAATLAITWDRDWTQADRYLRRALKLAPGDARVYHAYAALRYLQGDVGGGEQMLSKGLAIDPLSVILNADLVWYQTVSGKYEKAIATCQLIAEIDHQAADNCALHPNLLSGRVTEAAATARARIEQWRGQAQADSEPLWSIAGLAHLDDGELLNVYWRGALNSLSKASESRYVDPVNVARLHAHLGQPLATLRALEQAVEQRSMFAPYIHLFPEFRGLHNQPRFIELLAKIGLPKAPQQMLAQLRESGVG